MNNKQFENQNNMSTGKVVLGVLAGAAVGAVLGILFAPDKGSATRKKIKDMTGDFGGDVLEKIKSSFKNVTEQFENTKEEAKDLVENAKSKAEEGYKKFQDTDHQGDHFAKA